MAPIQVGWIGLGSMGIGMSKNLQKYLSSTGALPLLYTNRTLSRGDSLKSLGAKPVETVREVTQRSTIIFSCVSNDAVLRSVVDDIAASGSIKGKVYVDCSTVHPDTALDVSKQIVQAGGEFVAVLTSTQAPVFGASPVAEAGRLIFVTAGPRTAIERISPYLKGVMGRSVIDMGEEVSKSSLLKIAGNICVVSFMEVIAEAHVFAEKTGLGSRILEDMLSDNFGPVIGSYSKRITTGAYAPAPNDKAGFDVALAIKDARHALNCARDVGATLQVSEVALKNLEIAQELQQGKPLDSSSMYGTLRVDAGLDFYTDLCKKRDSVA
ncbi:6-phosphogluconate dehydrogenase [Truncatella angustata]|uniref:6-phosphogluconate dehydrogenase n=1 Tax=Truncatella angustata TaxID=152316 RepID=A0A9P8UQT8_9PEZI|nr:6-phosphogluconate dehydrogenase [Truncatella angustata]KAH6656506.1 6-phosphogluconate dehydrogenase [Truncatella angustata]